MDDPKSMELIPFVCPKDREPLDAELRCPNGHVYPVVEGIPILLSDDLAPTLGIMSESHSIGRGRDDGPLYLRSVGVSDAQRQMARELLQRGSRVDPVAAVLVAATSGLSYAHLVGRLSSYPIPDIPLPEDRGASLLDIGCSWGRWSISAAAKGFRVVGIDPSFGAVLAASRVAREMGHDIRFVCGDARSLPFATDAFDYVFSYSVVQHFSIADADATLDEIARVLRPGGRMMVQMAHRMGLRSGYHQLKRGFREPIGFEVRYWSMQALQDALMRRFSSGHIHPHCFFGLGLERSDAHLMKSHIRPIVAASEALKAASERIPALARLADSVYLSGTKAASPDRLSTVNGST